MMEITYAHYSLKKKMNVLVSVQNYKFFSPTTNVHYISENPRFRRLLRVESHRGGNGGDHQLKLSHAICGT